MVLAAVASLAALTVVACRRETAAPAPDDLRTEAARLQQGNARLQRLTELAAGKEFYLVFDPAKPDLALMLRGAELQRYAVLGMMLGRPRVAWRTRSEPAPWQGEIWKAGALEPSRQIDRLVLEGPEPGKAETAEPTPPAIPRTAEELYPVPSRYLIRFADGLSVEIRPREADANLGRGARFRAWWSAKWRDAAAATFSSGRDAIRLRLVLNPKDAESLYRALPPDVKLIVL
jgi:hypothetical protein